MHAVHPVSSENLVNRFWQVKQFHSEFINLLLLVIPLEFQHLWVPFDYRADTVKKKKTLNANFPFTNLTLPEGLLGKKWIVQAAPWSQASPSTLTLEDWIHGFLDNYQSWLWQKAASFVLRPPSSAALCLFPSAQLQLEKTPQKQVFRLGYRKN